MFTEILALVAGVRVSGNRTLAAASAAGIYVEADDAIVRGNVAICSGLLNQGIHVSGANIQVLGNLATGCGFAGFLHYGQGAWTMKGNVAVDNEVGVFIGIFEPFSAVGPTKFEKNAVLGNRGAGIRVYGGDVPSGGATVNLGFGNIFSNGEPIGNCGLYADQQDTTDPITVNADKVFWGAASGPGANPADVVCTSDAGGGVTVNTTNAAAAAYSVKVPPQR